VRFVVAFVVGAFSLLELDAYVLGKCQIVPGLDRWGYWTCLEDDSGEDSGMEVRKSVG